MISMSELFRGRKKLIILIGLMCIALASGMLLTNGVNNRETINMGIGAYHAEELLKYRTEYVGDNVKVVNIFKSLPFGGNAIVSLQIRTKPYAVMINYDFKNNEPSQQQLDEQFYKNAAVAFALIKNIDEVLIKLADSSSFHKYTRQDAGKTMNVDLWSCSQDLKTFEQFLQKLVFRVYVSPLKYALTMSSTPGINIVAVYQGEDAIKTVRYSAKTGGLSTWEPPANKVVQAENTIELPYGKGVYWSPLSGSDASKQANEITVTVAFLNQDEKEVGSSEIKIMKNGYNYEVLRNPAILTESNPTVQKTISIEDAVRSAILDKASAYRKGETATIR